MKELYFKTSKAWREWLADHHAHESAVWLIFYNKQSGKPTMKYGDALDEALCYGWVDSLIRNIDAERYARKFTPRKDDSKWSEQNKKRVARLIRANRMTEIGLAKVKIAQQNGMWDKPDRTQIDFEMSPAFEQALAAKPTAKAFFEQLAPSHKRQYLGWIAVAKRPETQARRIRESIELLEKQQKLGMK